MEGVLRTWVCQNQRCGATFDAWENYPHCPQCKCMRTTWMPGGGNIIGLAREADRELRALADAYGMTNIASAREGERAMPALRQTPAPAASNAMQFAPGFVAPAYTIDSSGQARGVCMPSSAKVNFKVKAQVGRALERSGNVPGPEAAAIVEGRTRGKT